MRGRWPAGQRGSSHVDRQRRLPPQKRGVLCAVTPSVAFGDISPSRGESFLCRRESFRPSGTSFL
ncbi:hypothetical protein MPL1032_10075 [Mesorhizobium plurifarium]|uniref:Uncharacterized protein n=1 Tax=Mesorhizobium plurifarium TaxID=69974 RepID=A0A0K2VME6_MESPL|nr:hypothetical protein MPL1032_10075 [Mesorhizobium plurifarium]